MMAGLSWPSIRKLCSIFCCPPLPSRIAAKLAFVPPEPTYMIVENDEDTARMPTIQLNERADWQYTEHEMNSIEPFTMPTSRGERIAGIYIKCPPDVQPLYTILFSHGNAVDVGQMASFLVYLGARLQCDVITYDYAGYIASLIVTRNCICIDCCIMSMWVLVCV